MKFHKIFVKIYNINDVLVGGDANAERNLVISLMLIYRLVKVNFIVAGVLCSVVYVSPYSPPLVHPPFTLPLPTSLVL
jgi:hypothetical protein